MFDYVTHSELDAVIYPVQSSLATKTDLSYVNQLEYRVDSNTVKIENIYDEIAYSIDRSHECRICLKHCDQYGICEDCARRLRAIFFPTPVGMDEII